MGVKNTLGVVDCLLLGRRLEKEDCIQGEHLLKVGDYPLVGRPLGVADCPLKENPLGEVDFAFQGNTL